MVAGAGLNRRETVEFVIERAPAAIDRLVELGVPFNTRRRRDLHLTREGGHSHRRIVHVDDATGWAVQAALLKAAEANPNITLLPDRSCIDLITGRHEERYSGSGRVWGVYALDNATGKVEAHVARATILATGGAGRVYQFSTAPRGATGDGIAMAWRAGCRVSNMEMMQFHPTCLYNLEVKNFLITEAVRGEGGQLKHPETGHRFMPDYDERAELAPRDIVARAIDDQIKRFGLDYVHLDISHMPPEFVTRALPQHPREAARPRHRHDHGADPGGARAALHLRRDPDRPRRAHRPARPVGGGRMHRERPPRRQPPRLELAARMLRVRRGGGAATCSPAGTSSTRRRRSASGTKAASPIPTRKWSSSRTGPRSAASCGTTSASCAPPSGSSAPRTGSSCSHDEVDGLLRPLPRHHRPDRAAQPAAMRRPDRAERAQAPRKPRPALHARLSARPTWSRATRCWCRDTAGRACCWPPAFRWRPATRLRRKPNRRTRSSSPRSARARRCGPSRPRAARSSWSARSSRCRKSTPWRPERLEDATARAQRVILGTKAKVSPGDILRLIFAGGKLTRLPKGTQAADYLDDAQRAPPRGARSALRSGLFAPELPDDRVRPAGAAARLQPRQREDASEVVRKGGRPRRRPDRAGRHRPRRGHARQPVRGAARIAPAVPRRGDGRDRAGPRAHRAARRRLARLRRARGHGQSARNRARALLAVGGPGSWEPKCAGSGSTRSPARPMPKA